MGGWPDQFFSMTPRLYAAVAEGRANAEARRFRLTAWHAHTAAALDRARRLPALEKMIGSPDISRRKAASSPEALLAVVRRWQIALNKGAADAG